jgi:hypothetical protein
MATLNPQFALLRDSGDIIRTDDGTSYTTDTTAFIDCGQTAPHGNGDRTAAYREAKLVIDFSEYTSDDGADAETITIDLLLNTTESASGAVTHRLRLYQNADDGMAGRVVIPIHNFDLDTHYRYMGVKFTFAGAGLVAKWGAYFSMC